MASIKVGLEIHGYLHMGSKAKLFCDCNSGLNNGNPDRVVMRRLRASEGETGRIDIAAEHEQKKGKYFLYHFFRTV